MLHTPMRALRSPESDVQPDAAQPDSPKHESRGYMAACIV